MKLPWTNFMKNLKPQRNLTKTELSWDRTTWKYELGRFVFNWTGYNKYGLYLHDVMDNDHPAVKEALRRLPDEMVDARNFRIMRALQLSFLKIYLPREKWITYEQDLEYRYLEPYIHEINAEWDEMFEFDGFNYWSRKWPGHDVEK